MQEQDDGLLGARAFTPCLSEDSLRVVLPGFSEPAKEVSPNWIDLLMPFYA